MTLEERLRAILNDYRKDCAGIESSDMPPFNRGLEHVCAMGAAVSKIVALYEEVRA